MSKNLTEVGTRVLLSQDMELLLREKRMAQFSYMPSNEERDRATGWKVIQYCKDELKISPPFTKNNGGYFWESRLAREAFYLNCLKKFRTCRLTRQSIDARRKLKLFAKDFENESKTKGNVYLAGGISQVVGGILQAAGIILAPFSAGASLSFTTAGSGLALVGAGTVALWPPEDITVNQVFLHSITDEVQILNNLIGLYVKSQTERVKFFSTNNDELTIVQTHFHDHVEQATKALPVALTNAANLAKNTKEWIFTSARGFFLEKLKGTKFVLKLVKGKQAFTEKFLTSQRGFLLSTKSLPEQCKRGMGLMGIGAKSVISVMSIGFGAWDIVNGVNIITDEHIDIVDNFRATANDLNYILESTMKAYTDILEEAVDCEEENRNYNYLIVSKISMRSKNGQPSKYSKLKLTSVNPDDETDLGECYTDDFQVPRSNDWFFLEHLQLGDCRSVRIYEDSLQIKLINDGYDAVEVDYVTISTESEYAPSHICTETGDITSLNSSSLYSYNGCQHSQCRNELTCFPHNSLRMIRIHTCEQDYAGTDAKAKIQISQYGEIERGLGEYGEPELLHQRNNQYSTCTTAWLDNPGNDWEFGDLDTYRVDSLGKCARPFHKEFVPDKGYLGLSFVGDFSGSWCTDAVKLYTATNYDDGIMRTFRCEVWGEKGLGTWKHGQNIENTCKLQKPNKRGLKRIKIHIADYYYAASSGQLQLKLTRQDGKTCYTNVMYKSWSQTFPRNTWVDIKGGGYREEDVGINDQLGMCEDFIIDGSGVEIQINKRDSNSVGIDAIELYGGIEEHLMESDTVAFIACNDAEFWAESGKVYYANKNSGSMTYSKWYDWEEITWNCKYKLHTQIKALKILLCSSETAGSFSKFKAQFANIDKTNCQTKILPLWGLDSNDFQIIHSNHLGEDCNNLQIFDNKLYFNMFNMNESDSLCLAQVYVDISDGFGTTRTLKCKLSKTSG